jgi:hypothetical protein
MEQQTTKNHDRQIDKQTNKQTDKLCKTWDPHNNAV